MSVVFGLADRISVLVYGEIIATDAPQKIRANPAVQEAYLGHERRGSTGMLEVHDLHAYYGKSHILHGVNLEVGQGEIVSLLGRNGVGRSTTVKAIMGQVDAAGLGAVQGRGDRWDSRPTRSRTRAWAMCRRIATSFPTLTVRAEPDPRHEEREARQGRRAGPWRTCTACFRACRSAPGSTAGVLSGGEQQMLTLCRTLMGDPELIMIDEPTEGLAPKIVELVAELFHEIKNRGISILLVEQKLAIALDISQRVYVMGHGQIVFEGTPQELRENSTIRKEWLEV